MAKNTFKLKKPLLVWILASCFIAAPYVNLAATMWVDGIEDWYSPLQVWNTFLIQTLWAQSLLVLKPVAGVSLFIQRKRSWFLAVALLIYFTLENVYTMFRTEHLFYKGIFPLIINCSFLVVFRYFRFPYLDRRDQVLQGLSKRLDVYIPVRVEHLECTIRVISKTGCYMAFPSVGTLPAVNSPVQIVFEKMSIEGTVLRHEKNCCAVRFKTRLPRSVIKRFRYNFAADATAKAAA